MVVILLILLNILFYFTIPYGYYNLLGLNILFFKGAYWQILSSMFMHGNLTHLILNMIVLFQFGRILESYLGFLLYIIGGLMCSLLSAFYVYFSFYYFGGMINLVGASGAICVLMGYYAFLDKSSTKGLIVAILLMSFAPLLMGVNVAWYGHIFGFICGYFLGKLRRKI
ncbi:rhomboid family intramembrane serine protease [Campylobacter coli]|nr:rhomboid family intramembrane serine protease [Campylobacter coli]